MHLEHVTHADFNRYITSRPFEVRARRTEPRITEYRHKNKVIALMVGCEPNPMRYIVVGSEVER